MHRTPFTLMFVSTLLALALAFPTQAVAESGNFTDCLMGCIPGDSQCIDCCKSTFADTMTICVDTYVECSQICESQEGTRAVACFNNCQKELKRCNANLSQMQKEFTCPNWMAPHDCPFECQAWNPVSRKCVGAPKGCD